METPSLTESGRKFHDELTRAAKEMEEAGQATIKLDTQGLTILTQIGLFSDFDTLRDIGFKIPLEVKKTSLMTVNSGNPSAAIGINEANRNIPMAIVAIDDFDGQISGNSVNLKRFALFFENAHPTRPDQIALTYVEINPDVSIPQFGNVRGALFENFHHEYIMWPIQEGVIKLFTLQGMKPPRSVGMSIHAEKGNPENYITLDLFRDEKRDYPMTTATRALNALGKI